MDIHACVFWEPQRPAFFDVRVYHPNTDSCRDLKPLQIYRMHENEKKRQYSSTVLKIEHGTFASLVFTITGGMGQECFRYHSRLAELIALKKGKQYAKRISWTRAKTSFALLRSVLICLRRVPLRFRMYTLTLSWQKQLFISCFLFLTVTLGTETYFAGIC